MFKQEKKIEPAEGQLAFGFTNASMKQTLFSRMSPTNIRQNGGGLAPVRTKADQATLHQTATMGSATN